LVSSEAYYFWLISQFSNINSTASFSAFSIAPLHLDWYNIVFTYCAYYFV